MFVIFCVTHPKRSGFEHNKTLFIMSLRLCVSPVASRQIICVIERVIQNAVPLSFGVPVH